MKYLTSVLLKLSACAFLISCNNMSAEDYLFEGKKSAKMQNPEQAIEYYNKAIKKDPAFALAFVERGKTYFNIGEYQNAIDDFSTAIELAPDKADAYYGRGRVYQFFGDMSKACVDWKKAAEFKHPQSEEILKMCLAY